MTYDPRSSPGPRLFTGLLRGSGRRRFLRRERRRPGRGVRNVHRRHRPRRGVCARPSRAPRSAWVRGRLRDFAGARQRRSSCGEFGTPFQNWVRATSRSSSAFPERLVMRRRSDPRSIRCIPRSRMIASGVTTVQHSALAPRADHGTAVVARGRGRSSAPTAEIGMRGPRYSFALQATKNRMILRRADEDFLAAAARSPAPRPNHWPILAGFRGLPLGRAGRGLSRRFCVAAYADDPADPRSRIPRPSNLHWLFRTPPWERRPRRMAADNRRGRCTCILLEYPLTSPRLRGRRRFRRLGVWATWIAFGADSARETDDPAIGRLDWGLPDGPRFWVKERGACLVATIARRTAPEERRVDLNAVARGHVPTCFRHRRGRHQRRSADHAPGDGAFVPHPPPPSGPR